MGRVDLSCLTLREQRIVSLLSEEDRVLSREELRRELGAASSDRAVDAAITRIRRKIERNPRQPQLLLTAHGEGYRWRSTERSAPKQATPTPARWLVLPDRRVELSTSRVLLEHGSHTLTTLETTVLESLVARRGSWTRAEDLHPDRISRQSAKARVKGVVFRLRQKLEADPRVPAIILSQRALGYRLENARLASQTTTVPPMTWGFLRYLAQRLGLEDCVLYRREGHELVQVAAAGPKAGEGEVVEPIVLRVNQGIVGTAAATGEALIIRDTQLDQRYIPDAFPGRSELTVPIVHGGEVVGIFDSESSQPRAYGREHIREIRLAMDLLREGLGR